MVAVSQDNSRILPVARQEASGARWKRFPEYKNVHPAHPLSSARRDGSNADRVEMDNRLTDRATALDAPGTGASGSATGRDLASMRIAATTLGDLLPTVRRGCEARS